MNAVAIGPFAFSIDRLAVIMGIVAFLLAATLLARRGPPQFQQWTTHALFGGIAGARLGHVVRHIESFTTEPLRIVAFWEGGFAWDGATVGVLLPTLLLAIRTLPALPRAALAVLAFAAGWGATASLAFIGASPSAPLSAFSDVGSHRQVVIADRRGRPAVVNLWATWCPPCRREMPAFASVARANTDVDFIFANQGEETDTITTFLREARIELETVVIDPASRISGHYSAVGMPTTLFINADGSLAEMHVGELAREALADQLVTLRRRNGKNQPPNPIASN